MDEKERIALLARTLGARATGGGVEVGIGDDAAVLRVPAATARLVWTIDEQVDGTHFERALVSWRDLGWRSFMAAASDIAAMGAEPWCALSALVLPEDFGDEALAELARGQSEASEAAGAPVVGGNLARGPALSIATTLLGTCAVAIERRGARAGDALWMAGVVGHAAAGLRALRSGLGEAPSLAHAVEAWLRPRALVEAGRAMAGVAHAAIDVSDGLAGDLGHIAEASALAAVIDEGALVADAALVRAAEALGADPLDLALHGGEDYAILAASDAPIAGFRRIGEFRTGQGLVLRSATRERAIEPRGFDHFRTNRPPEASRS
jgi:thiamine-monophosphate kinase